MSKLQQNFFWLLQQDLRRRAYTQHWIKTIWCFLEFLWLLRAQAQLIQYVKNTESDQFEYRKYEGKISIQVVSDASINNSQTEHRTIRAKIRAAMLLNAENWTAVDDLNNKILPYYDVNYMRPAGTQYVVEGDLAISILEYKINLTIRNDQFPN